MFDHVALALASIAALTRADGIHRAAPRAFDAFDDGPALRMLRQRDRILDGVTAATGVGNDALVAFLHR